MIRNLVFQTPTKWQIVKGALGTVAIIILGLSWSLILFTFVVPLYVIARVRQPVRAVSSIFVLIDWASRTLFGIDWKYADESRLPDQPCVVVCKHQSSWETFVINRLTHFSTVSKKQLGYIPFFGWGLVLCGAIMIDRSSPRRARESINEQGRQRLNEAGLSVLMFPEGTRSAPGIPGDYKSSAAMLAHHAGVPLVPVAIDSGYYWPRRSWVKYPGTIRVSVGPPITTTGDARTDITKASEWIESKLDSWNLPPHITEAPAAKQPTAKKSKPKAKNTAAKTKPKSKDSPRKRTTKQ